MDTRFVKLEDVIGVWAQEYGVPSISFDDLIVLGKRAIRAYNIQEPHISFDNMCKYIVQYIQTPFGKRALKELANG